MRHLLLFLLAWSLPIAAITAADARTEAPHVAVLRLEDALSAFKMYTIGRDKLKKEVAQGQAKIDEIDERLKSLDQRLRLLNPDSDEFGKLQLEFETLKLQEKMMYERGNEQVHRKGAQLIKESYAAMRTILASFCQDHGIKLVHLAPNPDLEGTDSKEIHQALFAQDVLYFDPSLDITDAFIPYLNEHWSAQPAASGGAGTGATTTTTTAPTPAPSPAPGLPPAPAPPAPSVK